MNATWIVTANAGKARIFCQHEPTGQLEEVADLADDAARLRTVDTETDRLGPLAAGGSTHNTGGRLPTSGYEPAATPARHEMEKFARTVATCLLAARREERFEHLVLSASPEFLGMLRPLLDDEVRATLDLEVARDYTQASGHELNEHIRRHRNAAS